MADVVANGGDQKGKGIERSEEGCDRTFVADRRAIRPIGGKSADVQQEAEDRLQHIDRVSEVMVEDKGII